jgi:Tol biopolymer transport system component
MSVVFSSPRSGHGDLYRIGPDGLSRLTRQDEFEGWPHHAPAGQKILYSRESGGWRHVWAMDLDGGNQTQLTTGRVLDQVIGFSPDGHRAYFMRALPTSGMGREAIVYEMDIDGQNLRPRPPAPLPPWPNRFTSTDGSQVIEFGSYGSSAPRILASDTGKEVRALVLPRGEVTWSALSPDGRTIAISVLQNGVDDVSIYRVRLDDLTAEKLR